MKSSSFLTIIPSSSPIALKTFKTSSGDADVKSSGGISISLSPSSSPPSISISKPRLASGSPPSSSTSTLTSSSSPIGTSASGSSICGTSCSFRDFFVCFESIKDSLTNSLISCFIVEASIPFAFSLIAFSTALICNKVCSTIDPVFSVLIILSNALRVYFTDKYILIVKKSLYYSFQVKKIEHKKRDTYWCPKIIFKKLLD